MLFKSGYAVAASLALAILLAGSAEAHGHNRCYRHHHWWHRHRHCGPSRHWNNGHDRYRAIRGGRGNDNRGNGHDRGNGSNTK